MTEPGADPPAPAAENAALALLPQAALGAGARWRSGLAARGRGQDYAAELVETGGVAAGLVNTGRLGELDDYVWALAVRYRAQGPPTLLYVALSMLGYRGHTRVPTSATSAPGAAGAPASVWRR